MSDALPRCRWATDQPELYQRYHDQEWGVPTTDERLIFEHLCLEAAQAGLSWWTVLQKRQRYNEVFDQFDPEKIVRYDATKIEQLCADPGIIRNRRKIEAVVHNSRIYLDFVEREGSFAAFLWSFVDGSPIQNNWQTSEQVPVTTALSDQLTKSLKKLGFKFVGSVSMYAFAQAIGLVNDHLVSCHRHQPCQEMAKRLSL